VKPAASSRSHVPLDVIAVESDEQAREIALSLNADWT
jgi:hypothetical protein